MKTSDWTEAHDFEVTWISSSSAKAAISFDSLTDITYILLSHFSKTLINNIHSYTAGCAAWLQKL